MEPDCISSIESFREIEILSTLYEGRLFCIHKARQGTKYIILKVAAGHDAMSIELLRREYELSKSLCHPCVVSTLGFEENTSAGPAIVLEYIEGKTLDEYLSGNPSESSVDSILDDILDGVDYLHHRGILHNDLKPSNIIINSNGTARIIDFGLAISDDSLYKGCVGGSADYSAPEIMSGKGPVGTASDIYSLGMLIRIMSGRKYGRIIARSCHENPSERYRSVSELKHAISFRRYVPVVAAAALFSLFVLIMILPQKVEVAVEESAHNALKERMASEMAVFYIPTRDSMLRQCTFENAAFFKGEYLLRYVHFHDSLPPEQHWACEEIFAEHSAVLDSLMISLQ
mgnify:CR=1 FL=1